VVSFTLRALQLIKLSEPLVWTFKLPFIDNPSQSLSKLTNPYSNNTPVVSLPVPHAVQLLITPFLLLAMDPKTARITGLFKTHGQTRGAKQDSFGLVLHPLQVFAESTRWYTTHSQLTHDESNILSLLQYLNQQI
jgi:hypothetical protein